MAHHVRRPSTIEMESKVLTADSVSVNASEIDAQVRKITEPYLDPRLANYPNKFVAMTVDLDDGE